MKLFYLFWLFISIILSFIINPYSLENKTRFLVILFLLIQIKFISKLSKLFDSYSTKVKFILTAIILSIFVEAFHMISSPVFLQLRITQETSLSEAFKFYLIDLMFTIPAYIIIFYVIWLFINKYNYKTFSYIFIIAFAQTIGDGGLFFFLNSPFMLLFIPYTMTNYHAMNVLPFLSVNNELKRDRIISNKSYLVIPAIILTYLFCGSIIKLIGKYYGFQ
jgi:hypothetical protein